MSGKPVKVLALDTALFGCTVGLYDATTRECVAAQEAMPRGQAEVLVPMVQEVLARAETAFADIDVIAVTVGPGAFTGLRIGLATAQGFAIALKKPVVGLCTLDVLAAQYFEGAVLPDGQLLCVLIETKRQDYYYGFYSADGAPVGVPQALPGGEIVALQSGAEVVYIGDAVARFKEEQGGGVSIVEGYDLPDAALMGRLALEKLEREEPSKVAPLYLRGPDVSKPKKEQRKIL